MALGEAYLKEKIIEKENRIEELEKAFIKLGEAFRLKYPTVDTFDKKAMNMYHAYHEGMAIIGTEIPSL